MITRSFCPREFASLSVSLIPASLSYIYVYTIYMYVYVHAAGIQYPLILMMNAVSLTRPGLIVASL